MKIIAVFKYLLALLGVIFLFINWKVSIALYSIGLLLHVFPSGPRALLNFLSGYSLLAGIISLFFDWRMGIGLIVLSLLIAKFRVWGDRKNADYYGNNVNITEKLDKESE